MPRARGAADGERARRRGRRRCVARLAASADAGVGTLRPRLFIAQQLFAALTEAELRAALAHECGHLATRDNLKRAVLRACRDVLTIVPAGRTLDRAWDESTEAAADEHAARDGGAAAALDLAAALVKIARLAPPGMRPTLPA